MTLCCTATLHDRPHIIFILADDLVSTIYGPAVHTKLRQKVKEVKQSAYRPITGLYPYEETVLVFISVRVEPRIVNEKF